MHFQLYSLRSTAAPYTESRLTRSVANESVGFPVVEHCVFVLQQSVLSLEVSGLHSAACVPALPEVV